MSRNKTGADLLERYRALDHAARLARARLSLGVRVAAVATYDLRLILRICRILQHLLRKQAEGRSLAPQLERCYRATSRVRDLQVGVELVLQLEQHWPRNRRRPSTALKARLKLQYRALAKELDNQNLDQLLRTLDRAFARLTRQVPGRVLRRRARKRADKLAAILESRLRVALHQRRASDWHALRLAIKRFRFWVETQEESLPDEFKQCARALKPLQVALGSFNDWVVLEKWLPQLEQAPLTLWLPELQRHKQQALQQALALILPFQERNFALTGRHDSAEHGIS